MNNEQNEQWKCECGETVTANGEHLCWAERFRELFVDNGSIICSVKDGEVAVKEFIRKELSRTRSDALLEAVEIMVKALKDNEGNFLSQNRIFRILEPLRKKINES